MPYRSRARFLAPLALLAAIAAVYLVARPELGGSPASGTTTATTAAARADRPSGTAARKRSAPRAKPKTYTVKPGDVLTSIAETTGVAVADLQELNDITDAQSLRVGQKLKLSR